MTRLIALAFLLSTTAAYGGERQTRFYDQYGHSTGSAVSQSDGSVRYYDQYGHNIGGAVPQGNGSTRYYDQYGRNIGTSTHR